MKKWQKNTLLVLGTLAAIYAMVYVDVVSRARSQYLEGEKYWNWADHPEQRAQYLENQLAVEKTKLQERLSKRELSKDDYARELELLQFENDQEKKESVLKYAYVSYKTVVDLFSPPESKWVKMARAKLPQARERWKAELKAKNIPFEEYMID